MFFSIDNATAPDPGLQADNQSSDYALAQIGFYVTGLTLLVFCLYHVAKCCDPSCSGDPSTVSNILHPENRHQEQEPPTSYSGERLHLLAGHETPRELPSP